MAVVDPPGRLEGVVAVTYTRKRAKRGFVKLSKAGSIKERHQISITLIVTVR
jgi:hypothetical protein